MSASPAQRQPEWKFFSGSAPSFSDDIVDKIARPRSWTLRISVLPTKANTKKALQAAKAFAAETHPGFKLALRHDKWDGTQIDRADRDQRGKEICVFLKYEHRKYEFTPQNYKTLMLNLWKHLQNAGVELSYLEPLPGEKALPCDDDIATPFAYSAFKPFRLKAEFEQKVEAKSRGKYAENVRHGILHQTDYNPLGFSDPLVGITITKADLRQHGIDIKKCDAYTVSVKRATYHKRHILKQQQELRWELEDIIAPYSDEKEEKAAKDEIKRKMQWRAKREARKAKEEKERTERKAPEEQPASIPRKANANLNEPLTNPSEAEAEIKATQEEFLKLDLSRILGLPSQAVKAAKEVKEAKTAEAAKQPYIKAIEQTPFSMQKLYRKLVHLDHEITAYHTVKSRLVMSDSGVKTHPTNTQLAPLFYDLNTRITCPISPSTKEEKKEEKQNRLNERLDPADIERYRQALLDLRNALLAEARSQLKKKMPVEEIKQAQYSIVGALLPRVKKVTDTIEALNSNPTADTRQAAEEGIRTLNSTLKTYIKRHKTPPLYQTIIKVGLVLVAAALGVVAGAFLASGIGMAALATASTTAIALKASFGVAAGGLTAYGLFRQSAIQRRCKPLTNEAYHIINSKSATIATQKNHS